VLQSVLMPHLKRLEERGLSGLRLSMKLWRIGSSVLDRRGGCSTGG
jgi:hypothetical protein